MTTMTTRKQLVVEVPDDVDDIVLEHPSGEIQEVEVDHADEDEQEGDD
jgi:hypothetical protein